MDKQSKMLSTGLTSSNTLSKINKEETVVLKASVAQVMVMVSGTTDIKPEIAKITYETILESYPNLDVRHVVKALKEGSAGKLSVVYKVSPIVICSWIKQYMETNPPYLDFDDYWIRTRGCTVEEFCEERGYDPIKVREFQSKMYNEKNKK
jgi:hypothetical protein